MTADPGPSSNDIQAERLERGEVLHLPVCPFALPEGPDRTFLSQQQLSRPLHKSINYDPSTGKLAGCYRSSAQQVERCRDLLAAFGEQASAWLTQVLPRYAASWRRDRVSFHPEEEATRRLRLNARNDLLHLEAFPSRPTQGWRILRLFVNVHPTDPRVWVTSDTFAQLLARYGSAVGLPTGNDSWTRRLGQRVLGLFQPGCGQRSVYDSFMLRFHHFLKSHEEFQERCRKRFWSFAPGSAWLVFTDTVSHAVLRGRFALDHSFFVAPDSLLLPEESPPVLLQRACGVPSRQRAA